MPDLPYTRKDSILAEGKLKKRKEKNLTTTAKAIVPLHRKLLV